MNNVKPHNIMQPTPEVVEFLMQPMKGMEIDFNGLKYQVMFSNSCTGELRLLRKGLATPPAIPVQEIVDEHVSG